LLAGVAASALIGVAGAQAQTSAAAPIQTAAAAGQDAGAGQAAGIAEIVVTARRREENLQKVPISITAFSQETLEANRVETATDLQFLVPSLNVSGIFTRNEEFFTLRGMGETGTNISSAPGGGPAVVAYFAEAPMIAAGGSRFYYDLSSVQVLKGPQGTLFGRNTTGGAILFEPQRPTDTFGGYAQLTFGDYGDIESEGALNVPIVPDKLLARIAFQQTSRDGYTEDVGPFYPGKRYDNEDSVSGRFSLLWTPSDRVSNYFVAYGQHSTDNGPGISVLGVNPASEAALLFPVLLTDAAQQQARGPRRVSLDTDSYDLLESYGVNDQLTVHLSDKLQVKDIISWAVGEGKDASDRDGMPAPLLDAIGPSPGLWHPYDTLFTNELQFQGKSLADRLQWQAGFYYEDNSASKTSYNQIEFFNLANNFLPEANLHATSDALYGQGTYSITPKLNFTLGYRYTWDHLTSLAGIGTSFGGPPVFTLGGAASHSGWSGTIGLDYQLTPDQLLYVTSRRGYKSGGFNLLATGPDSPYFSYQPENDVDVEGGWKASGTLGSAAWLLDTDVFYTWYNNAQVAVSEVIDGQASGVTTNAAAARIYGFEFQGTLKPGDGLDLTLGYSFNQGRYTRYFSPLSGDLSGTPISGMSKNKLNVTAAYHLPLDPSLGALIPSVTYTIQSRYFAAATLGDPFAFIPGYSLLNARIDWKHIMGSRFDAGVFVTNALNKTYQTSVIPLYTSAYGFSAATYGPPRMFGAQLRYAF
jgi:iron complex outermembrane receptor protein